MIRRLALIGAVALAATAPAALADEPLRPARLRFADEETKEAAIGLVEPTVDSS